VETGTHRELMRRADGVYRNFWELQSAIQKMHKARYILHSVRPLPCRENSL